jgi:hypothetical protein
VPGATGYLLQQGASHAFLAPVELYEGGETRYAQAHPGPGTMLPFPRWDALGYQLRPRPFAETDFCRVKALGGREAKDSPWSNVV